LKAIFLSERFRETVRTYPKQKRKEIGAAIDALQRQLGAPHQHSGLGVRKLVRDYFELRVGRDLRLVFKLEPDAVIFVFAGNHDDVQRLLKSF
jgi:mRNA-degrading endonuclease YafQ of YafQ-DinJ toxin-antitoxin module